MCSIPLPAGLGLQLAQLACLGLNVISESLCLACCLRCLPYTWLLRLQISCFLILSGILIKSPCQWFEAGMLI